MVDFAKYLPLSNQPRADESEVTGDRRGALAAIIVQASVLISNTDAASHAGRAHEFLRDAKLPDAVNGDLATVADAVRRGGKRSIRQLSHAVRALLALGDELGVEPEIASTISGAVALSASGSTSFERRAVLRGHTVKAIDEEWEFGFGPVLEGTGRDILRFVLELGERAPMPASSPR